MLKKIIDSLQKANLAGWQVRETHRTSHQTFLALDQVECRREVETVGFAVTVYRDVGAADMIGLSSFRLDAAAAADDAAIDRAVKQACDAAALAKNRRFELPSPPATDAPDVALADPTIGAASLPGFEDRLRAAVSREKGVRLSAAEFFIDRVRSRLRNHRGLDMSQDETVLQTEFILLAAGQERENEFIVRHARRFAADFDLEGETALAARRAREATEAVLPATGVFPVVFSEEPLDGLFDPLVARARAGLVYNKMVQSELGHPVTEGPTSGDPVTLWSNPLIKGAIGSNRFDGYGTPGQRVKLIDRNRVAAFAADQRYASYMNVPVTGEIGNIEVEPGTMGFDEMLAPARNGADRLYHITAFSAFEPNDITGAFSAEIRAGYEISAAGVKPIKGGSVSGVVTRDMARARLSRELVQRERALVPRGVFFPGLTLAGA